MVFVSDTWSYFEGLSSVSSNWNKNSFDDSSWKKGEGGFGYGDGDDNTIVEPANSLFIRISFNVFSVQNIEDVLFHIDYDDGFVAYLNGVEIARSSMADVFPAYDALTTDQHEAKMQNGGEPEEFQIEKTLWENLLIEGENVLAIQIHNSSVSSSDMSAIPFLSFGINDNSFHYRSTPTWFQEPFNFSTSNLPIVIIETQNGREVIDEPKIKANMKIINNPNGELNHVADLANDYNGAIGIEIRGSYSATLPQKPYGIETRDSLGENNNVKLLGMPKENDWILLANYNDKSFMRNSLAFHLFEKMGHYAPRTKACEVLVNDDYQGIYLLTERIKQDKNRVDISKLDEDDNAGDSLTGGYIFKIDYPDEYSWESNFSPIDRPNGRVLFVNHDPKGGEITNNQQEYLKWFINEFETVLYSFDFDDPQVGYRSYIDVETFIDYFIIGELSRNVDAYKKSRYFYKDKDSKGGLLSSGPVWDFDWAWKNLNDCSFLRGQDGSGWAYKINECNVWPTPPSWIVRFLEDPYFVDQLYTRYFNLRETILSETYLQNYADSIKNLFAEPQLRHYKRWPILGKQVGAPETDKIPDTYNAEVDKLVQWINTRLGWIDKNLEGNFLTERERFISSNEICIYPNPANELLFIETDTPMLGLMMYNVNGSLIYSSFSADQQKARIDVSQVQKGLYFIRIEFENERFQTQKIVIRH